MALLSHKLPIEEIANIEFARFALRFWRESDAAALLSLSSDTSVSDMSGMMRLQSEEEAASFIKETLIPRKSLAILEREGDDAIGSFTLFESVYSRAFQSFMGCEAAFSLARPFRGRGFMGDLLRRSLEALFSHSFDFVCCGRFSDNARCESLLRSLGFKDCFDFKSPFIRSDGSSPREILALCTPLSLERANKK